MDGGCPIQELIRCPVGYKPVSSGQMVFVGCITIWALCAFMHSDTLIIGNRSLPIVREYNSLTFLPINR